MFKNLWVPQDIGTAAYRSPSLPESELCGHLGPSERQSATRLPPASLGCVGLGTGFQAGGHRGSLDRNGAVTMDELALTEANVAQRIHVVGCLSRKDHVHVNSVNGVYDSETKVAEAEEQEEEEQEEQEEEEEEEAVTTASDEETSLVGFGLPSCRSDKPARSDFVASASDSWPFKRDRSEA
ncbi:unnamed protein product, partial [Protopolystoma xenopodis]